MKQQEEKEREFCQHRTGSKQRINMSVNGGKHNNISLSPKRIEFKECPQNKLNLYKYHDINIVPSHLKTETYNEVTN